jgi:N-acetylneuraminic acid mutarotase
MHSVSTGCDGRIYVIGGLTTPIADDATSTHQENSVEVYDPEKNAWFQAAPMLTPRVAGAAATGADGRIYTIGGEQEPGFHPVSTVETYDPTDNTWSQIAPLPQPLSRMGAVTGPDGRIWVVADRATYVYAPDTNSWASAAAMPTERIHHQVVMAPDGLIWALGGFSFDGGLHELDTVEIYDPSADVWSAGTPMPDARAEFAAAAVPDGRVAVLGGSRGARTDAVSIYDLETKIWTPGPDMPIGLSSHMATVTRDGRIMLISGHAADRRQFGENQQVLLLTP